jgi:hypothetical protein
LRQIDFGGDLKILITSGEVLALANATTIVSVKFLEMNLCLSGWAIYKISPEYELGMEKGLFSENEKRLIYAVTESVSRIVEGERAETEIRKCRDKIEAPIRQDH